MRTVRTRRPVLVGEALVVLVLVFVYDRVREFAAARADLAIANGRRILSVESWTHVDIEPAMNRFLSQHSGLELLSSWYYQLMHLSVTLAVLLWIYWRHPIAYRSARNALIGINTVALVVFWVLPVAPPRLIPGAGFVDSAVVSDVADKVSTVSPDLYAAMPSLHVAWATWVALQVLLVTSIAMGRLPGGRARGPDVSDRDGNRQPLPARRRGRLASRDNGRAVCLVDDSPPT